MAAHVLRLAVGLRDRGWRVEVAASPGNAIRHELGREGVEFHALPLSKLPGPGDVAAARALRSLDRRRGFSIVHAHSSKAGGLTRSGLPRRNRLVYTPHCFAFLAGFSRAEQGVYRAMEQALVPRSGAIVAVCEWEREEGAGRLAGARSRTRVIYNGVEPCGPAEPHPALRAFAGGRPLAGMVTVLRPQKDPLGAIRAMADLARGGTPPGRLAIVGNGMLRDSVVAEIERLGVAEHVRWFPFEGQALPYLAALDLFVLPAAWEAFPIALLEAMSCGVPVLATRVGGVPEVVQDGRNGRLVAPECPRALAEAMEELLLDEGARRALGEAGRRTVLERFGAEEMIDRTDALYRELLARR